MKSSPDETKIIRTAIMDMGGGAEAVDGFAFGAELRCKSNKRYRFIRSVGFGGMKAVLLVLDTDTGREVAMAMIPDFRDRPEADIARFTYEARLTAQLEHPNIVPVHDMGIDLTGAPFFTMKYLRGKSLATLLRQVKREEPAALEEYTLDRAVQIFIRACNAVVFAHSKRVLHLDVKPDNVNIGDFGEVLVLDWGLAMHLDHLHAKIAPARQVKGTPGFMSPEQAAGDDAEIDERSDVYSLGALLYTMIALQNPLSGLPVEEMLMRTRTGDIPPPSEVASPVFPCPAALEAICRKAMQLDKNDRYQSVADLRADIQTFSRGYAPVAENASPLRKTALFVNRNFLETLLGGVILLLLGLLGYVLWSR